jgi:membrane protein YqaA with SNARE-associated domain
MYCTLSATKDNTSGCIEIINHGVTINNSGTNIHTIIVPTEIDYSPLSYWFIHQIYLEIPYCIAKPMTMQVGLADVATVANGLRNIKSYGTSISSPGLYAITFTDSYTKGSVILSIPNLDIDLVSPMVLGTFDIWAIYCRATYSGVSRTITGWILETDWDVTLSPKQLSQATWESSTIDVRQICTY